MKIRTALRSFALISLVVLSFFILPLFLGGLGGCGQSQEEANLITATVTRVVDGDTAYVNTGGRSEKVRFIGVDAPENTREVEPYGKEAAAYTTKQLLGKKVWLELDAQERDKYGRLLAYVWLAPPNNDSETEVRAKMLNARLLLEGYAQVMTVPPNVKYADLFVKLQREAREAGKECHLEKKKGVV